MTMQERSQKYKGKYKPQNPKKYMGDSSNIIYRSMWERRCMKYFDHNPGVLQWSSEEIAIPYYDTLTKKVRRYFPDFLVKTDKGKKFCIEIKPSRQCVRPKKPKRTTKNYIRENMEYAKKIAKWESAKKYCANNNMTFKIITEKDLGSY